MQRSEKRLAGNARRSFLRQAALAGTALLLPPAVSAVPIAEMTGEVTVNGRRAMRETLIKAGDTVKTGANAMVSFVIGADAFMLRAMSEVVIENKTGVLLISGLRVITGAMLAVFGPGMRNVMTGLVTAAIRGTGIYVEVLPEKTYFCTCYGHVGLTAKDGAQQDIVATNHRAHFVHAAALAGNVFAPAPLMNHENRELATLEKLAGRAPRLTL
ncbi:MAG: hypothetical protein EBT83_05865 [Betaproteobacteria bacterium]|nr:hypothetical protein [Betaproteobacteria bacterium]